MFNQAEDLMKKMYEEWEKSITATLEKMVRDQAFVAELAKSMAATMNGKALYSKFMDDSMAAMNLPTRKEMIQILQKLTDLEERLIDLIEKFEDRMELLQSKIEALTGAAGPGSKKTQAGSKTKTRKATDTPASASHRSRNSRTS